MGYNFKGLFIKEEENTETMKVEKPATTVKNIEPKVENVMPMVRPAVVETRTVNNGFVDKEIEAKIWDKIVSKNLPGPDYIEFKNVAAGLVDITPDESMQMRGAFNVLKRTYPTFTKEIITTSIDTYITIVNEEKELGLKECDGIRKTQIGDKIETINNMKNSTYEILKQIDELKKKYETMNSDITKLELEVTDATNEITKKEEVFKNSVQSVIDTLNSDKAKVINLNI